MATAITIQGGSGSDTINFAFTVTGTETTLYSQIFADFVNNRLADGDPLTKVSPFGGATSTPGTVTAPGIYELLPTTVAGGQNKYFITSPGYIIDSIGGAATVGSLGHDTILVAAINAATTFNEAGNTDKVIFVTGNNTFNGDTTEGGGANDTIVAGSGFDTINTGAGATTVNSGTGNATIYLQDTAVGSTINDYVWLDDGHAVVYANGANDAVITTIGQQTIVGGTSDSANLTVVLQATSENNSITAGAGNTTVFAESSGNTVNGGSGGLFFVSGENITATVNGGGGQSVVFGAAGDSISFGNVVGAPAGLTELVAGGGSETLDGSAATSGIAIFGSSDTASSDYLAGGSGNDTIQAGVGNSTLAGGAGANLFVFNAAVDAGGTITINDFGSSTLNDVGFTGYDPGALQAALQGGQEVDGNYVVTLSDNTQITFVGLTGPADLNGHVITF